MAKKNKRKWWLIGLVGILALLMVVGYFKYKNKDNRIEVELSKVERRTLKEVVTASGKVFPQTEVKITSDVSGEILQLFMQEGDSVKQGQVLAKIDPDEFNSQVERGLAQLNVSKSQESNALATVKSREAQLIQARAQLENTIAQLKNAEALLERNKKLVEEGVISDSELDQLVSNYEALQANRKSAEANIRSSQASVEAAKKSAESASFTVESSEASLKEMKTNLRRTTIYSPISGIVSKLNVEQGERVVGTIQMTGTELMRIANFNVMETKVEVSENDVVKVNVGDSVDIEISAYPNRVFLGTVSLIANSSSNSVSDDVLNNDQVTNFFVTISIDEKSYSDLVDKNQFPFRPGMSASVEINTATINNQLSVPIQAVTIRNIDENSKDEVEVVFVKSGDSVKWQPVGIGIQDDEFIHITKGLTEGDEIVSGPYSVVSRTLEQGSKVKQKEEEEEK